MANDMCYLTITDTESVVYNSINKGSFQFGVFLLPTTARLENHPLVLTLHYQDDREFKTFLQNKLIVETAEKDGHGVWFTCRIDTLSTNEKKSGDAKGHNFEIKVTWGNCWVITTPIRVMKRHPDRTGSTGQVEASQRGKRSASDEWESARPSAVRRLKYGIFTYMHRPIFSHSS
jgi:hypothetical protein